MASPYASFVYGLATGLFNLATDPLYIALVNGYTPNYLADTFFSDISPFESSGAGYTTGGQALASQTVTQPTADSWTNVAAINTVYQLNQIVRPATPNGFVYACVVPGTSGASAPAWPTTPGLDVTDGTVTWLNLGSVVVVANANANLWPSASITATGAVVYKRNTSLSNSRLITYLDFGGSVTSTNDTFTVPFDPYAGFLVL